MSDDRVVRVKGHGVVHAGNNQATVRHTMVIGGVCHVAHRINAVIRVASSTVMEASSSVSSASQELHTRLLQIPRVEPQHLVTESIHIHTEHDYHPNGQRGDPKYVVQQAVKLTLLKASGDDVADAIDRMVNAAGNALQLNGVTVRLNNTTCIHAFSTNSTYTHMPCTVWGVVRGGGGPHRHRPENGGRGCQSQSTALLRGMLVTTPAAPASLPQALGVRVGRVLSIAEAGAEHGMPFPPPPMGRAKVAMAAEGFAGAPVNMGDGAVEASVWVTFQVENDSL